MERTPTNLKKKWKEPADVMELNLEENGQPVFQASNALDQGYLRKKSGYYSLRFSGDTLNSFSQSGPMRMNKEASFNMLNDS